LVTLEELALADVLEPYYSNAGLGHVVFGLEVGAKRAIYGGFAEVLKGIEAPRCRDSPERRLLEKLWVPLEVPQLTVSVEASSEQVVQQALLYLLQFGDELIGPLDGLVQRVEDLGDTVLLTQ